MRAIALRLVVLWGWRRALAACTLGAASALAMPPYGLFPILFVTFPALVWLLDGAAGPVERPLAGLRAAAAVGWAFGFGFFFAGLYWVGEAFLVDAGLFGWMVPFVVVLFPAGLALFTAAACALATVVWAPGLGRILSLAAAWTAMEWLRGHVLSGFPWNAIGYAFSGSDVLAQTAALWGIYGQCFLVVAIAAAPATLADDYVVERTAAMRRLLGPAAMLLAVVAVSAFGYQRLASASLQAVDGVRLRIVQPAVAQAEKWQPQNRNGIFARYLDLSNQATSPETMGIEDITHLVWPESAVPFLLQSNADALAAIAALLPEQTSLITGALRRGELGDDGRPRVYNSVFVIDSDGAIRSIYDKTHLVPFGEYLPFERVLRPLGLRKLVAMPLGFAAGDGPALLRAGAAPAFSPLVCYEAIFPGAVTPADQRPGWLLNVTNDAWFGDSAGPYQHLALARTRALEEGLPMVRAANTGVSALIDPYGRIVKRLELNRAGIIDSRLPAALAPTLYAQLRDLPVAVLILLGIAGALVARFAENRAAARLGRSAG